MLLQTSQQICALVDNGLASFWARHVLGERKRQLQHLLQAGDIPLNADIGRGVEDEVLCKPTGEKSRQKQKLVFLMLRRADGLEVILKEYVEVCEEKLRECFVDEQQR